MKFPCGAVHDEYDVYRRVTDKIHCELGKWQGILLLLVLAVTFSMPVFFLFLI